jgi:hypothetical protein
MPSNPLLRQGLTGKRGTLRSNALIDLVELEGIEFSALREVVWVMANGRADSGACRPL